MDSELKKENKTKKDYLKRYQQETMALRRIEDELEELRLDRMFPTSNSDGMPHAHNNEDGMSKYAVLLDKYERKLIKKKYRRIRIRSEIRNRIEQLENENEKNVLTYRYIRLVDLTELIKQPDGTYKEKTITPKCKLMEWDDVAVKMGYSRTQIDRFHSDALKNLKMG